MGRRRGGGDEGGGDSWLNTYADMVTLLLTFFIMLFSMSSVQDEKWEALLRTFGAVGGGADQIVLAPEGTGSGTATNQGEFDQTASPGGSLQDGEELPADFNDLYAYLKNYVNENNMEGSVEVSEGEGSVFIRLSNSIFFNPDSYELKAGSGEILDFLGSCLKNVEDELQVININGHTAATAYNTYPVSDRRLSGERAASVAIYFEDVKGVDPKKILSIGYGKQYPIASNDTADGREQNRRVELVIISNQSSMAKDTYLYDYLMGTFDPSTYPESGGAAGILAPGSETGATGPVITGDPVPDVPGEVYEDVSPYDE